MGFPDRIERSISVAHPPAKVWEAITTAEGLGTWFGHQATVDLRVGGLAQLTFEGGHECRPAHRAPRAAARVRLHLGDQWPARRRPAADLCRVHARAGVRGPGSPWSKSGFAQLPDDLYEAIRRQRRGRRASSASSSSTSMPGRDPEAVAEEVFAALADPSRRSILAALAQRAGHGDGPGGQPADHPAGDRQAPRVAHRRRAGHRRAGTGVASATGSSRRRSRSRSSFSRRWPATGTRASTPSDDICVPGATPPRCRRRPQWPTGAPVAVCGRPISLEESMKIAVRADDTTQLRLTALTATLGVGAACWVVAVADG